MLSFIKDTSGFWTFSPIIFKIVKSNVKEIKITDASVPKLWCFKIKVGSDSWLPLLVPTLRLLWGFLRFPRTGRFFGYRPGIRSGFYHSLVCVYWFSACWCDPFVICLSGFSIFYFFCLCPFTCLFFRIRFLSFAWRFLLSCYLDNKRACTYMYKYNLKKLTILILLI